MGTMTEVQAANLAKGRAAASNPRPGVVDPRDDLTKIEWRFIERVTAGEPLTRAVTHSRMTMRTRVARVAELLGKEAVLERLVDSLTFSGQEDRAVECLRWHAVHALRRILARKKEAPKADLRRAEQALKILGVKSGRPAERSLPSTPAAAAPKATEERPKASSARSMSDLFPPQPKKFGVREKQPVLDEDGVPALPVDGRLGPRDPAA